ncbi:MAG: hypothetical protein ACJ8E3_03185 [Sphingomicrobium sp.]
MNPLWDYLWPLFVAGLVIGALAATIGFRRGGVRPALAVGLAATLAAAALWHGPVGAAGRFTGTIERGARQALKHYEMSAVTAHLHRGPLSRRLILSGSADDFQRSELARLLSQLPGVSGATWSNRSTGLPLIVEGLAAAVVGFLIGAVLAYVVELRRRYNAQWRW